MTEEEARVTLATQAKALADTVGILTTAVDQLERRTGRSERINIWVSLGLGIDLVLSVVVAVIVSGLVGVIDRERSTREEALCPLYSLLLGSYNPASRAEGPPRDAYIRSFQTLRDGYVTLDCADPVTPPRVDQPPATIPAR